MHQLTKILPVAVIAATVTAVTPLAAGTAVHVPIVCSRGPSGQQHVVTVSAPAAVQAGAAYTVRIDHASSGQISHVGLNYIFDMSSDYLLPPGATYVAGSARILPGTGTPNVAAGARLAVDRGTLRLVLPAHVPSGGSFTAPSLEVKLTATAPAGVALGALPIAFAQYRVNANAFLVGDVATTCDPRPKPYVLATTRVSAPADAPAAP